MNIYYRIRTAGGSYLLRQTDTGVTWCVDRAWTTSNRSEADKMAEKKHGKVVTVTVRKKSDAIHARLNEQAKAIVKLEDALQRLQDALKTSQQENTYLQQELSCLREHTAC